MTPQSMMREKSRYEIIFAGAGGQGLILSAIILGEAAIREGKKVVQTQSYGIATRGGLSEAEVIIDSEEIIFQQVQNPDIILAMTEGAFEKFRGLARTGALIFYDETFLEGREGNNLCGLPFTRSARDLGHGGSANLIALGAIVAGTRVVRMESLAHIVTETFPPGAFQMNMKALRLGENLITSQPFKD
ncbi:MAG: 2-oxoacid:ferredoxin oxidoreductase subunit gamma [Syntrophorhabdus aromaticivorans]|uniref:2-oxoacid:ferredoxin oxidoreductase subunit gamma n=1 Tax=Syntrophorhabdus aromaticivorans TaxID=328301 RepID=A0A971S004_9BACT|nr:2-oxoacid:ferredoxin oxidoreductase subunit gamma [Syntrophorhabdus aromaticivorans]